MNRLSTLVYQYYRIILFNNVLFSCMCAMLVHLSMKGSWVPAITLGKFIGLIAAIAHHNYMYGNSFYYFRNAGLSIRRLYLYAALLDFLVYLLFITSFILLRHAAVYFKS